MSVYRPRDWYWGWSPPADGKILGGVTWPDQMVLLRRSTEVILGVVPLPSAIWMVKVMPSMSLAEAEEVLVTERWAMTELPAAVV